MNAESISIAKPNGPRWVDDPLRYAEEEHAAPLTSRLYLWLAELRALGVRCDFAPHGSTTFFSYSQQLFPNDPEATKDTFDTMKELPGFIYLSSLAVAPKPLIALSPSETFTKAGITDEFSAVQTVDSLDVRRQLESLRSLKDGWAEGMQPADRWGEGYGKAPIPQGLDWLAGRFAACYPRDLPRPYLYPTPDGGVQAEWSLGANEASLEVDLASHQAEWHCLNVNTRQSVEWVLYLDDATAWAWLEQELRRLRSMAE